MTAVVKFTPSPAQRAAKLARLAVAEQRAARAMGVLLDGLTDPETIIEANRALIRKAGRSTAQMDGEGRAAGVICGALVAVSPGYRATGRGRSSLADQVFKPKGNG